MCAFTPHDKGSFSRMICFVEVSLDTVLSLECSKSNPNFPIRLSSNGNPELESLVIVSGLKKTGEKQGAVQLGTEQSISVQDHDGMVSEMHGDITFGIRRWYGRIG